MSDQTFATITPSNALARLAFSNLYDTLISGGQNSQSDGAQAALRRMAVDLQQTFDGEILRLRLEVEKRLLRSAHANGSPASESPTEPDTDTEQSSQEMGMIWVGRYLLGFQSTPSVLEEGWTMGKSPVEGMSIDLRLCTKSFAKRHEITLRNPHARFNFAVNNKGLCIFGCSRYASTQLTVNGEQVDRNAYHLNQPIMKIQLDKLDDARTHFVTAGLGGPPVAIIDMPTPLPSRRTIGKWTLGDALGIGGQGRVFFGSDSSGNMAAIKVVERTSRNCHRVDEEIEILKRVTELAEKSDDGERILQMVEVIYSNEEIFSHKTAFDNVTMVLKPIAPQILADLVKGRSKGGPKGMTMEAASAFRDALVGVKVMHDEGWLHRDLKPTNIGFISTPPRSVLLDVGTSRHIQAGGSLRPEPGTVGTVGYLAPELELEDYDHSIDIWSMAVILYELTYGHHPWKLAINPWRDDMENKKLRPSFQKSYQTAVDKMATDSSLARKSPTKGYIHLGSLFIEMVRYRWAPSNRAPRLDINEVLAHPAWGPLLPESLQVKRQRLK